MIIARLILLIQAACCLVFAQTAAKEDSLPAVSHAERALGPCELPPVVGKRGQTLKTPWVAVCDTMRVPEGATTRVLPGTLIHWAVPKATNHIIVEGELRFEGSETLPIMLGSGIDTSGGGVALSQKPWWGITVRPEAKLYMRYVFIQGTVNPLWILSQDYRLMHVMAMRAKTITLPGRLVDVDPVSWRIEDLASGFYASEVSSAIVDTTSAVQGTLRGNAQDSGPKPPDRRSGLPWWRNGWFYGFSAVGLATGAGAWLLLGNDEPKSQPQEVGFPTPPPTSIPPK